MILNILEGLMMKTNILGINFDVINFSDAIKKIFDCIEQKKNVLL